MKKILYTIAIIIMMVSSASAQDGFFRGDDGGYRTTESGTGTPGIDTPLVPNGPAGGAHDMDAAPLGSGLLILTVFGAGYAVSRRKNR